MAFSAALKKKEVVILNMACGLFEKSQPAVEGNIWGNAQVFVLEDNILQIGSVKMNVPYQVALQHQGKPSFSARAVILKKKKGEKSEDFIKEFDYVRELEDADLIRINQVLESYFEPLVPIQDSETDKAKTLLVSDARQRLKHAVG